MSTTDLDIAPPNAFFAAQERQRQALLEIADGLKSAADEKRANPLAPTLQNIEQRLGEIGSTIGRIDEAVRGLDQTVRELDRDRVDYVTALYAAAIDTTGVVVQSTNAGQWIVEGWKACKQKAAPTICDIATLRGKPAVARQFIAALIENRGAYPGIAQDIGAPDLRRFISLAQGVCDAIGSPPPPAAGPAATPPTTS